MWYGFYYNSLRLTILIIQNRIGIKPISTFGIAHNLKRQDIAQECARTYPRAAEELASPEGLVDFMSEYLVDISFLEDPIQNPVLHPQPVVRGLSIAANRPQNETEVILLSTLSPGGAQARGRLEGEV